jgi:hypothetical protein
MRDIAVQFRLDVFWINSTVHCVARAKKTLQRDRAMPAASDHAGVFEILYYYPSHCDISVGGGRLQHIQSP